MQRLRNSTFWRERTAREQWLLGTTGVILLLVAIYLGLIEPAIETRRHWQQALPQLRAERAQMQSLAKQLGTVAAPESHTPQPLERANLERNLADAGIQPTSLEVTNDLIHARWSDVSFNALHSWLVHMQREQALIVTEANIIAHQGADRVDATVSLRSLRSAR